MSRFELGSYGRIKLLLSYMNQLGISYKVIEGAAQRLEARAYWTEQRLKDALRKQKRPREVGDREFQNLLDASKKILDERFGGFAGLDAIGQALYGAVLDQTKKGSQQIEGTQEVDLSQALRDSFEVQDRTIEKFEKQYSGLWYVVRPGTDTNADARWNLSLLSIAARHHWNKPVRLPHFVYSYFGRRRDESIWNGDLKFDGSIVVRAREIICFGRRRDEEMKNPITIIWKRTASHKVELHETIMRGIVLGFNKVEQPMAAQCIGVYVSNSNVAPKEFEIIEQEKKSLVGLHSLEELLTSMDRIDVDREVLGKAIEELDKSGSNTLVLG